MSNDRLFADEANLPRVEAICGAAIDLINAKLSPLKFVSVSTILIDPGKASQLHYHRVMEEVYYFISGNGHVTVGDKSFAVAAGTAIGIPVGHWHQVLNTGAGELKFISADSPSFDPTDVYFQ